MLFSQEVQICPKISLDSLKLDPIPLNIHFTKERLTLNIT